MYVCVDAFVLLHTLFPAPFNLYTSPSIKTEEEIISTSIKTFIHDPALYPKHLTYIHAYALVKRVRFFPLLTFNSIKSNKIWNNTQSKNNYQNVRSKKPFHVLSLSLSPSIKRVSVAFFFRFHFSSCTLCLWSLWFHLVTIWFTFIYIPIGWIPYRPGASQFLFLSSFI